MAGSGFPRAVSIAIWMGIIGNAVLFGGKIVIGLPFNSIAIISDSLNSFTDIIASTIVFISIRSSYPGPRPRSTPSATSARSRSRGSSWRSSPASSASRSSCSLSRAFSRAAQIQKGLLPILLVVAVMVVKLGMHLYARVVAARTQSTALMASAADHRNDVLISAAVLVGVVAANLGLPILDPIVAILIGLWIIRAGLPSAGTTSSTSWGRRRRRSWWRRSSRSARAMPGVLALNDVFAHYVGTTVEIEVHINVDNGLNIEEAHAIGKQVQWAIEGMEEVSRAFIHIDPLETER